MIPQQLCSYIYWVPLGYLFQQYSRAGSWRDSSRALVLAGPAHTAHPKPCLLLDAHHPLPLLAHYSSRKQCARMLSLNLNCLHFRLLWRLWSLTFKRFLLGLMVEEKNRYEARIEIFKVINLTKNLLIERPYAFLNSCMTIVYST